MRPFFGGFGYFVLERTLGLTLKFISYDWLFNYSDKFK